MNNFNFENKKKIENKSNKDENKDEDIEYDVRLTDTNLENVDDIGDPDLGHLEADKIARQKKSGKIRKK